MGSYDRVDFYRKNRDYAGILDEDGGAEEEVEEEVEEEAQEYDEDEEGSEERSEPEEDPEVVREREEYLERRAKLKELERQKLKRKINGLYGCTDNNDLEKDKKKLPYDNYGSFFGPSQPVVARRVIEETRARQEAAQIAAKVTKLASEKSYTTASDTRSEDTKPPKVVVSETKKKAQQLKAARDYSFLFNEDAEIPGAEKGSEAKTAKSSRPDNIQQKQAIARNSTSLKKPSISGKQIASTKDPKGVVKPPRQMPAKVGTQKTPQGKIAPPLKPRPSDPSKQINKVGSGSGSSGIQGNGSLRPPANNVTRVGVANGDKRKAPLINGNKSSNVELQRSTLSRPTGVQKSVSSKVPMQKLQLDQKKIQLEQRKPSLVARPAPSLQNRFEAKPTVKPALKPTPNLPPKPQMKSAKPRMLHDEHPKKRPPLDDDFEDVEDGGNYRSLIRHMFGYNPNKYRNLDDEDDRDMEVGFNRIQAEERRSERLAREEDERELALIEAEEREERLRAKKRKLQNK